MPAENDREGLVVLSIDPVPIGCRVCHIQTAAGWVTAISRDWAAGDGERCRLCPVDSCCVNARGNCLRQFAEYVHPEEAPLFLDPALAATDSPALNVHV